MRCVPHRASVMDAKPGPSRLITLHHTRLQHHLSPREAEQEGEGALGWKSARTCGSSVAY